MRLRNIHLYRQLKCALEKCIDRYYDLPGIINSSEVELQDNVSLLQSSELNNSASMKHTSAIYFKSQDHSEKTMTPISEEVRTNTIRNFISFHVW